MRLAIAGDRVQVQWETPREEMFHLFGQSEIAWTGRAGEQLRVGTHSFLRDGDTSLFLDLGGETGTAITLFLLLVPLYVRTLAISSWVGSTVRIKSPGLIASIAKAVWLISSIRF